MNLVEVRRAYDASTLGSARRRGAGVVVFDDSSFEVRCGTPPTSLLSRKALGGNGFRPPSREQRRAVAGRTLPDPNTGDLAAAMRTVAGTARSAGVSISD